MVNKDLSGALSPRRYIWLVDDTGRICPMTVSEYSALSMAETEGTYVRLSAETAAELSAQIMQRREGRS